MSGFPECLDEEGKQIYNEYMTSLNKWCLYVREKTIVHLNEHLTKTGKIYNSNEYYNASIKNFIDNSSDKSSDKPSAKLNTQYKKLSLLFHPDKFHNVLGNALFTIINKFYNDGNEFMIEIIDDVSQYILEIDTINNIVENLDNSKVQDILEYHKKNNANNINDAKQLFDLLNTKPEDMANILDNLMKNNGNSNVNSELYNTNKKENQKNEELIASATYKFYTGCQNTIKYINETFITEAELIDKINTTPSYMEEFIWFCNTRYGDNENILGAITEWIAKRNQELGKENEQLRERIAKLSK